MALGDRFEVLEELARDGMVSVVRARDKTLDRVVAVKFLSGEFADDPALQERFKREAQTLAKFNHPNIVQIHGYGEADGEPYIEMELVEGPAVAEVLPVSTERAAAIAAQVCDALEYAHSRGVVHRDIKPETVLLDDQGNAKISDFGIARLLDGHTTVADGVVGTPYFIAPEVLAGAEVTPRADVFAVGALLYVMITGDLPVGSFEPLVGALDQVVRRALAAKPDRRFQSAAELKAAIEAATTRSEGFDDTIAALGDTQSDGLEVGTLLDGKFRIERLLGEGAMGAVYEITHVLTQHRRAMKLLHAQLARDKRVVDRFLREATAAGRIGSPHIIETYDAGWLSTGEPYLVMELLDGETLSDRLEQAEGQGLPFVEICDLFEQLADGVQAAHDAGIVHRDLKPDNIYLSATDDGPMVKILDFGVSKFELTSTVQTASGAMIGTPMYMSPEQFSDAAQVDSRSDVFALGVILYEMLAGAPPFGGATIAELMNQVLTVDAQPIAGVPDGVNALLARAMSKNREDRDLEPRALAAQLAGLWGTAAVEPVGPTGTISIPPAKGEPDPDPDTVADTVPIDSIAPPPLSEPDPRPKRSWPLLAAAAVAGAIALGYFASRSEPADAPSAEPTSTATETPLVTAAPPNTQSAPPPSTAATAVASASAASTAPPIATTAAKPTPTRPVPAVPAKPNPSGPAPVATSLD
ncbi:MAG: protein kinase [Deltaproteobacteria bacterium]|nr:protein kinase [Deltaproteobacteria bacterium]MBW2534964.1 protein kinase [Deltaproteobacteria bacterium]